MPAWLLPVGMAAGQWLANRFAGPKDEGGSAGKSGFDWTDLIIPGAAAAGGFAAGRAGKGDKSPVEVPFLNQLTQSAQAQRSQGTELRTLGTEAIGPALKYLSDLVGADPQALMDATRQERGRVIDQYDTARRAISQFGPRGGGTTSALAESRFAQAESLADITSSARRDAVSNLSQLGPQLTALGLTADQLASQDINSIINAVLTREGFDVQKRGQNMEAASAAGEAAATLLGIWLTRDKGKTGGTGGTAGKPS